MGSFSNDVEALVAVDSEEAVKGLSLEERNSELREEITSDG